MRLIGSPTSPFVRKVRVLLIEKGFDDIEVENVNAFEDPKELIAHNPMSRVPVMILTNGVAFYDSKLIVDYIESNMQGPKFVPEAGASRWFVLQAEAHADTMIDVAIRSMLERKRPAEKQMKEKIVRDEIAVARGVGAAAKMIKGMDAQLNLGHIAIACAMAYVDFRLPHLKWRDRHPELSAWYQEMRLRASMQATAPEDPV
ncbi:MAG: glutathione S-transferase [Methyloligella sp.]|jgi:glutathione S-transferase|nr:MAG: glutathione S-transferase [Methyloligella sp.]